jgi:hypothetical protein
MSKVEITVFALGAIALAVCATVTGVAIWAGVTVKDGRDREREDAP